jgi:thioredoxin 2
MTAESRLIGCPSCGATNRVPNRRGDAGGQPVCGRCKTPLPMGATGTTVPVTVSDATFAAEVERSALPVLLDAWATMVWAVPDDRARGRIACGGVGRPRTRREAQH